MAATKFAISVPTEVMQAVDRAARERGITRSRFIGEILRRVARAKRDEEISRRIDKALSDPRLTREQRSTASDYRRASSRGGGRSGDRAGGRGLGRVPADPGLGNSRTPTRGGGSKRPR